MNLDRLTRLEDLTRRYAKHRPCGAGLGMLDMAILLEEGGYAAMPGPFLFFFRDFLR